MNAPQIYRYVVRFDRGTAPNPYDGYCTLAICKPAIRRTAQPGDWILGYRSLAHNELVYAMKVSEKMPFARYWDDTRFHSRKPGNRRVPPDNLYLPSTAGGLEQVPDNGVHDEAEMTRDLSGVNVLIAKAGEFWYFGATSLPVPNHLEHLSPVGRGHVVYRNRQPSDVEDLVHWLNKEAPGMRGLPTTPFVHRARRCVRKTDVHTAPTRWRPVKTRCGSCG